MLAVSIFTCCAAFLVQRRYVSAVSKRVLDTYIIISEPFFVFTRRTQVQPRSVKLSHFSIRDLLGRPHTAAEREAREKIPLTQLEAFTIEVNGRRMLVDTFGKSREERAQLHEVLGVSQEE